MISLFVFVVVVKIRKTPTHRSLAAWLCTSIDPNSSESWSLMDARTCVMINCE